MNDAVCDSLERHFDTAFAAPDGIKKLRELILTLAMQGKLVAQDPNDPPARQLLKEIEAEKKRLVKEGKIKAPKPLPEIKPEEVPYALPQGWEWVRLGDVVEILDSLRKPVTKQDREPGPYPYYGASGIVDYVSNYIFDEPIVLVGEDGAKWGKGDNTAFAVSGKTWVNNHAHVLRPERSALNDGFLIHCLVGMDLQPYITGMTVPKLNQARLVSIVIPLPPLAEQHRIVAKIDQLMARCDELEKLRDEREQKRRSVHTAALKQLLDAQAGDSFADAWQFIIQHFGELYAVRENVTELRKAILQLAVMGKLAPQNPNDPPASQLLKEIDAEKKRLVKEGKIKAPKPLPEIKPEEVPYALPQGWEWVRLGSSMLKITDGTHHSPPNSDTGEFLYISAKNIKDDGVLLSNATYVSKEIHEEIYSRCDPEFGNILYIKDGATTGIVTINNLAQPFSMLSSVALLKQPAQVNNRYLLFTLRSPFFYSEMRAGMTGVAITRVTLKILNDALIPLPPISEQHRIVAKIDALMTLCDTLDQQIDAATLKQSTLLDAVMAQV